MVVKALSPLLGAFSPQRRYLHVIKIENMLLKSNQGMYMSSLDAVCLCVDVQYVLRAVSICN